MSALPSTEADIETITRHEPLEWQHAEPPPLSGATHDAPDLQEQAVSSAGLSQPVQRTRAPLVVGLVAAALVVASLGAAITWWPAGTRQADVPPPVAALSTTPSTPEVPTATIPAVAPAAVSSSINAAPPSPAVLNALSTPADVNKKSTPEAPTKTEKAKTHREAVSKRKAGSETTHKTDLAATTQADESKQVRDATARSNKEELIQLAKRKPAMLTPQQACADRSNFISRGICESRECEKPERATLKFCVDMRERRVIHD